VSFVCVAHFAIEWQTLSREVDPCWLSIFDVSATKDIHVKSNFSSYYVLIDRGSYGSYNKLQVVSNLKQVRVEDIATTKCWRRYIGADCTVQIVTTPAPLGSSLPTGTVTVHTEEDVDPHPKLI
jgi:hypothetical protein